MRLSHLAAAAAAFTLVAAPALAAPINRALKLSLTDDSGQDEGGSRLAGAAATTYLLAGLGAAAVVAGAVALGSNDNTPASM